MRGSGTSVLSRWSLQNQKKITSEFACHAHALPIARLAFFSQSRVVTHRFIRRVRDKPESRVCKCHKTNRLSEKSFVLFIQYPSRHKQRPLRGLTYSTLKFMRSTCGKSIKPIDMSTAAEVRSILYLRGGPLFVKHKPLEKNRATVFYSCPVF